MMNELTPKEQKLNAIDEIITGLQEIRDKVSNDIRLENEDWIKVAVPMCNTIELFMNQDIIK